MVSVNRLPMVVMTHKINVVYHTRHFAILALKI